MINTSLWQSLLELNEKIRLATPSPILIKNEFVTLHWEESNEQVFVRLSGKNLSPSLYQSSGGLFQVQNDHQKQCAPLFKVYLDTILANHLSSKLQRCVSVGHFAQSLDSKIATAQNDSKWIGNSENQMHAHRMRALCDGIIVGKNTFTLDNPSLNVRHVEGPDPIKIIIGGIGAEVEKMLNTRKDEILAVTNQNIKVNSNIDLLTIPCDKHGYMECADILLGLYHKGIKSVYIEGGATTMSNFIESEVLDYLQVHIAPLIFGSGKDAFVLKEIKQVKEAVSFKNYDIYLIGGAPMFAGIL